MSEEPKKQMGTFSVPGSPAGGISIPVELLRVEDAGDGADGKVVTLAVDSFREILLIKMSEAYNTPGMEEERRKIIRHSFQTLYQHTSRLNITKADGQSIKWEIGVLGDNPAIHAKVKRVLDSGLVKAIVSLVYGIEPLAKKAPKKRRTPALDPSNKFPLPLAHSTAMDPGGQLALFPPITRELIQDGASNPDLPESRVYGEFTMTKPLEPKHYRMRDAIVALAPTAEEVKGSSRMALTISLYKLAQVYSGEENPRGGVYDMVMKCLDDFRRPEYWARIRYTTEQHIKRGKRNVRVKITDTYIDPEPLVKLINREAEYTDENGTETRTGLVLEIHPVFVNPIKFALVPGDLIGCMTRAWIKPRTEPPAHVYVLRDTLLYHMVASTKGTLEIDKDKLYPRMFPRYYQDRRAGLMDQYLAEAADTMKRLGLIARWEMTTGVKGQGKLVFTFDRPGWNRICSRPGRGVE